MKQLLNLNKPRSIRECPSRYSKSFQLPPATDLVSLTWELMSYGQDTDKGTRDCRLRSCFFNSAGEHKLYLPLVLGYQNKYSIIIKGLSPPKELGGRSYPHCFVTEGFRSQCTCKTCKPGYTAPKPFVTEVAIRDGVPFI